VSADDLRVGERRLVARCADWPVVAAGIPPHEPAVVVRANRVLAASPAARAEGVAAGQRRREAQGRCPALVVVDHDEHRDARRFEPVAAALEAFTPRIELTRPGTAGFTTRGPSRYFGGDDALAACVRAAVDAALAPFGWSGHARVAVADGAFTATLAARHADPVLVVAPGDGGAFLAPLPVGVLAGLGDDGRALAAVLVRLGLTALGAFAAVDPADVVGRFGAAGAWAHRLARGLDPRPPDAAPPPPELTVETEIDPPADRVDVVAFAAKRLADDLHRRLEQRGLACTRVVIVAETEHGERLERAWRHEGALAAAAVADRARWQLDGWLTGPTVGRPTAGVNRLALVPDEVVPGRGRQLGFWGGEAAGADRAARALARVQGLLGPDAVTVPEWRGGRGPAERIVLVPTAAVDLTEPRALVPDGPGLDGPGSGGGAVAPWPGRIPPPAPATVPPVPRPADVVDGADAPVAVDGRGQAAAAPARLSIDGGPWAAIEAWAGPWPCEERWWDPAAARRRARFQVVAGGRAHLLTLEGGRWWVEATYD
jgi:protein ImuB